MKGRKRRNTPHTQYKQVVVIPPVARVKKKAVVAVVVLVGKIEVLCMIFWIEMIGQIVEVVTQVVSTVLVTGAPRTLILIMVMFISMKIVVAIVVVVVV